MAKSTHCLSFTRKSYPSKSRLWQAPKDNANGSAPSDNQEEEEEDPEEFQRQINLAFGAVDEDKEEKVASKWDNVPIEDVPWFAPFDIDSMDTGTLPVPLFTSVVVTIFSLAWTYELFYVGFKGLPVEEGMETVESAATTMIAPLLWM